jgi:hypothetical protein
MLLTGLGNSTMPGPQFLDGGQLLEQHWNSAEGPGWYGGSLGN